MRSVCFSSSSNILVCIAFSRLRAMTQPLQASTYETRKRARNYLCAAWVLAILTSVPQLLVYELYFIPGNWFTIKSDRQIIL